MNRTAYNITVLTPEIRRNLLTEARECASHVRVDQLDCSVSFARQPTDKTIDEVFEILFSYNNTFWNFIHREGDFMGGEDYFDVGGATMNKRPDYFLWITLSIPMGKALIDKYGLTVKYQNRNDVIDD